MSDDSFMKLDEKYGIHRGWSRPAQRILLDNPTRTYEKEVVAVPTREFVYSHKLNNWLENSASCPTCRRVKAAYELEIAKR